MSFQLLGCGRANWTVINNFNEHDRRSTSACLHSRYNTEQYITFNKSVQIVFNHDESLEVSNTSIITKYVVFDLFFFCTGSTK